PREGDATVPRDGVEAGADCVLGQRLPLLDGVIDAVLPPRWQRPVFTPASVEHETEHLDAASLQEIRQGVRPEAPLGSDALSGKEYRRREVEAAEDGERVQVVVAPAVVEGHHAVTP